jgi:hypothetical protein
VVDRFPGDGGNATQRAQRFATILNKAVAAGPIPEFECRNYDRRGGAWIAYVKWDRERPGTMAAGYWAKSPSTTSTPSRILPGPI